MSDHIIRRGSPPTTPPAPRRRRRTIEISEEQLRGLIHGPTQDDLEAELELLDVTPESFPDCTPTGLSSASSQRLAHTMRRGSAMATPATPATPAPAVTPTPLPERTSSPPIERVASAPRAASAPRVARTTRAASTASAPLPQLFLPSLLPPDPEPREMTEIRTMVFVAPGNKAPVAAAATPLRTLLRTERARLVLLVTLLGLGLGAAVSWLL